MLKTKKQKATDNELLEMCRKCYAFKYENSWHFERPQFLAEKDGDEKVTVRFSTCSACIEEALAFYDVEYA